MRKITYLRMGGKIFEIHYEAIRKQNGKVWWQKVFGSERECTDPEVLKMFEERGKVFHDGGER